MQLRWEAIPRDVAQSMAFEREPAPTPSDCRANAERFSEVNFRQQISEALSGAISPHAETTKSSGG